MVGFAACSWRVVQKSVCFGRHLIVSFFFNFHSVILLFYKKFYIRYVIDIFFENFPRYIHVPAMLDPPAEKPLPGPQPLM